MIFSTVSKVKFQFEIFFISGMLEHKKKDHFLLLNLTDIQEDSWKNMSKKDTEKCGLSF